MDITEEIEQIMSDLINPENQSAEHLISIKANTGDYVFASDGKIRHTDYEKYQESIRKSFERVQKFIKFERIRTIIYPLAIDAATCTTEMNGKYISTSGDTILPGACVTYVFKKFDNEWKVIQGNGAHTSD